MSRACRELHPRLEDAGVSRRQFLGFCATLGAIIGLGPYAAPRIADALDAAFANKLTPAVWLDGGSCTGCTVSLAQSEHPDIATIVLDILSLNYMDTLMFAAGSDAEEALRETVAANKGRFLLLYEGAVMTGLGGNALRVAGRPGIEQINNVAPSAAAVLAIGSCAVDGGWVRATPNPAGATGIGPYLSSIGVNVPVVNLPTCPVNPAWVVAMIVDVLLLGGLADSGGVTAKLTGKLDEFGRPRSIYSETIHDNCPRRGHFDAGEFVYEFGSTQEANGYCLYAMGCKGPETYTRCPVTRWNDRQSWCVDAGSPCIGCGSFNWVDENAPFAGRFRRIGLGSGPEGAGFDPAVVGTIAASAVAGVAAIHAAGMAIAGRLGKDVPTETTKEYDLRHPDTESVESGATRPAENRDEV
jgi:hydrogenase small subunit